MINFFHLNPLIILLPTILFLSILTVYFLHPQDNLFKAANTESNTAPAGSANGAGSANPASGANGESGPTLTPSPTTKPMPTTNQPQSISVWLYPGAQIEAMKESYIILISFDSPDLITEWYKNKINNLNLNSQSFVTTNTNNNVLNKLVAAGNSSEIEVEISKSNKDLQTQIKVSLEGLSHAQ